MEVLSHRDLNRHGLASMRLIIYCGCSVFTFHLIARSDQRVTIPKVGLLPGV